MVSAQANGYVWVKNAFDYTLKIILVFSLRFI